MLYMSYSINVRSDANLQDVIPALQQIDPNIVRVSPYARFFTSELPHTPENCALFDAIDGVESSCDGDHSDYQLHFFNVDYTIPVDSNKWYLAHICGDTTLQNYTYDADGSGVPIYFVDTRMNPSLAEFGGRATVIHDPYGGTLTTDHGTATASWAAGNVYGVAPGALIFNAAGFDNNQSGTTNSLNAALLACLDHYMANFYPAPAVLNCSWSSTGTFTPNPFTAAIQALVDAGVHVVCSAGNGAADMNGWTNVYPAEDPNTITVGAYDKFNVWASFSNRGAAVEISAPGVQCAGINRNGTQFVADGTSLSSPFVAACIAAWISSSSEEDPLTALFNNAINGQLTGVPSGTINLSTYKPPVIGANQPPAPPPPSPAPQIADGITVIQCGEESEAMFIIDGGKDQEIQYSPFHILTEVGHDGNV